MHHFKISTWIAVACATLAVSIAAQEPPAQGRGGRGGQQGAPGSPAAPAAPAKPEKPAVVAPEATEPAGDKPKVISLDQFRKK